MADDDRAFTQLRGQRFAGVIGMAGEDEIGGGWQDLETQPGQARAGDWLAHQLGRELVDGGEFGHGRGGLRPC